MTRPLYVGIPKAERNAVAVARSYFKRRGLLLDPLRAQLVWAILATCKAALRHVTRRERRQILTFLLRDRAPTGSR